MTRQQVEDLLETAVLKFTQILTEKLEECGEKQKEQQRLAREYTFEQGTGFTWEQRHHVRNIIGFAHRMQKSLLIWKTAIVVAFSALALKSFWTDIFGG